MKRWSTFFACALLSSSVMAEQTLFLPDGKQVLLKDDFTWEYVSESSKDSRSAVPVIPVAKAAIGTTIKVGDDKPSLQLSRSGVDVLIGASRYDHGELTLPVSITNQNTQPVVVVTLSVEIYSPTGELLFQDSFNTWQSIKRLADTYLRPQRSAEGKSITAEVTEHPEYQIKVTITDVQTR
ncbi:DUF3157 family protein [Vibrio sp. T187]|uniref:DUF3157 family protein n=1 Tax=Vibrio TaxID=662 RepID=UPI0010C9F173|nr:MULTISPECIES: DUF3157 family protein [Vibrio]MBW3698413.1 DUF3157 family protein [Vibrio sp. T187]